MKAIIQIQKCLMEVKHQFHYDEKQSSNGMTVYACAHCDETIEVIEDAPAGG